MPSARPVDHTPRGVLLLIVLLTVPVWFLRFVQDDAFISFRYAQHLADGDGLVFNVGQAPVEGYTNFLWTVLLALPHLAGLSPIVFVYVAGLVLFPCALLGTYRLGRALFDTSAPALVGVLLVATNFSFVSYATGGLETMLQTALIVWVYALCAQAWRDGALGTGRAATVSLLAACAGLTRMDSAVALAPAGVMAALLAGRSWRIWLALALPVALLIGGWLAWKVSYYGSLLPNTFEAKAGTGWSPVRGGWYLVSFLLTYALPIPLLVAYLRRTPLRGVSAWRPWVLATLLPLALWGVYLVYTGGDFMEYRFIVPVMPLGMLLLASPAGAMSVPVRTVLVVVALAFSVFHGLYFDRLPTKRGLESIADLTENLDDPETGWTQLGLRLGDDLRGESPPVLALTPVGAVGYYSGLPIVDMVGLNDADIAREGVFLSNRAGHRKVATVEQLVGKGVHLLIGHPQRFDEALLVDGELPMRYLDPMYLTRGVPDPGSIPDDARVVAFPSTTDDEGPRVFALQLAPHPRIDALVEEGVWSAYDIGPATGASPMGG